jgi:hypothetical protein
MTMTATTPPAQKATAADRDCRRRLSERRPAERGQTLVLFVLLLATMILIGIVAVGVGQAFVRRHQAQLAVDAAALAGASAQAEGLSSMAKVNEKSLDFLRAIQVKSIPPHLDTEDTTWARAGIALVPVVGGALAFAWNDWAGDARKGYQKVFGVHNRLISIYNCLYSPPVRPRMAASRVVDRNFSKGGEVGLFVPQDLVTHGMANPASYIQFNMVKLTEPKSYKMMPYSYAPNPSVCTVPLFGWAACALYGKINGSGLILQLISPQNYSVGRFYDNDEGDDVRFAYFIQVSQTPVIMGRNFFHDLPPITVMAAAKPYDGYLGHEYESSLAGYWWGAPTGKKASATYRAKLVPLTAAEVLGVWVQTEPGKNPGRWATVMH